jgi:hypothetical protein
VRLHQFKVINESGGFRASPLWESIDGEIKTAIRAIVWPPDSDRFVIPPTSHGSGVGPIKEAFVLALGSMGWIPEMRLSLVEEVRPGPVDAVKYLADGRLFLVEWETGNISSSHRSVNRMLTAMVDGRAVGGALVVARTETLYPYLTDRVGNDRELLPYFRLWSRYPLGYGLLGMYVVDYDDVDIEGRAIPKGTDGRALV